MNPTSPASLIEGARNRLKTLPPGALSPALASTLAAPAPG